MSYVAADIWIILESIQMDGVWDDYLFCFKINEICCQWTLYLNVQYQHFHDLAGTLRENIFWSASQFSSKCVCCCKLVVYKHHFSGAGLSKGWGRKRLLLININHIIFSVIYFNKSTTVWPYSDNEFSLLGPNYS